MSRFYAPVREIISINQHESGRLTLSEFGSPDKAPSLLVSSLTHCVTVIFETIPPKIIDVTHAEYETECSFILEKAQYFKSLGEFQIMIVKVESSESYLAQYIVNYCAGKNLTVNIKKSRDGSLIKKTKTHAIWIKFDCQQNKFRLFSPTDEQLEKSLLTPIHSECIGQPFKKDPFKGYNLSPKKERYFQKFFGRFLQNIFDPRFSKPNFVYDSKWLEEYPILSDKVKRLITEASQLLPSNWLDTGVVEKCIEKFITFLLANAKIDDPNPTLIKNLLLYTLQYLQYVDVISSEVNLNDIVNKWAGCVGTPLSC
jgi:hypothetical protein